MLRREYTENNENLFYRAYELAKNLDLNGLKQLADDPDIDLDEIYLIDEIGNDEEPEIDVVYKLALEGYDAAVDMLVKGSYGNDDWGDAGSAADAYVRVSRIDKVMEMLAVGADPSTALNFLSWHGDHKAAEILLKQYPDADIDDSMIHAIEGGHPELAEWLCRQGGHVVILVDWLAYRGYLEKTNDWIEQGTLHANRKAVARALGNACHFDNHDSAVAALSHFDSPATRLALFKYAAPKHRKKHKQTKLLHDATTRNAIMRKYKISTEQAKALQVKGLRTWLLQGRQKPAPTAQINHDVFFKIVSATTNLSRTDAEDLYDAVCENTYEGAKSLLLAKQPGTLFAKRYGMAGAVRRVRHRSEIEDLGALYQNKRHRSN